MFNSELKDTFQVFSTSHLMAVLIVILALLIIYRYRKYLRNNLLWLPKTLAYITIGQEIILHVYRIATGIWSLSRSLPLHLCSLGVILSSYVIITKNKKVFSNTFFVMMIGALMAVLTPSIQDGLGFPHFRFFQFFLSHGMILVNITYVLFVYEFGKEFTYRDLYRNVRFLLIFAVIIFFVNLLTSGNYLYLMAKPGPNTAFDLFGKHPWYVLNILVFGIPVLFHLFYLPFFVYHRKKGA